MKNTNDQININIRMIENEHIPESVKQHTVWVETKSNECTIMNEEQKTR
jgi:hypothetical protein